MKKNFSEETIRVIIEKSLASFWRIWTLLWSTCIHKGVQLT